MKTTKSHPLRLATPSIRKSAVKSILAAVASAALLTACGGGAQTTELPPPQGPGGGTTVTYNGTAAPRDADVQRFLTEFWLPVANQGTCANCHDESVGQTPQFMRGDDINLAYDAAITVVNLANPGMSRVVERVGNDHHCWVAEPSVCSAIMTSWIENWAGAAVAGGRTIQLTPPPSQDPADSLNFPESSDSFRTLIHEPLLSQFCSECHSSEASTPQQPYHSDPNIDVAYDAAKPKIDLNTPVNSRLVQRLLEGHHCWTSSCTNDAAAMEAAIAQFAGQITPTSVDPDLITSLGLRLVDGTVASGGNRFESNQFALWEFKTGQGSVAFDTSGVAPAIDLTLSPEVTWFGGWGITMNGGKAQGSTAASAKINDFIAQSGGQFSIEAWVINGNVTQEDARIVSYSAGNDRRNFTLQQNLYDYEFQLRSTETDLNGDPALATPAADEVAQATLQHVVATYDSVGGRQIYVNGQLVSNTDPIPGGTLGDWDRTYAFVLGSEVSNDGLWDGTLRMVAVHNAVLTQQQIQQNFDVGVGEKFFLLFDISDKLAGAAPESSYILFAVEQFDSWAYLFDTPHFITLDGSQPEGIAIEGMRIAMNGREVPVGQTYATLVDTLSAAEFQELGQPLSDLGAVVPLDKGPEDDQFFLTFDRIDSFSYDRPEAPMLVITPADLPDVSDIGVKTFDEINATFASVTGVDPLTPAVDAKFIELRQSLPSIEDVGAFVSSQQVAIAQLAIQYCDALIDGPNAATMFPGFNFGASAGTAFAPGSRDAFVDPLIDAIIGHSPTTAAIGSQPSYTAVHSELAAFTSNGSRPDNLIDRLLAGPSDTRAIAKGVCAATLGNAATLVQ